VQVVTLHLQSAPPLWGAASSSPWCLLQKLTATHSLQSWPAIVRQHLLRALALTHVLPIECPESMHLSPTWSAVFLAPIVQHMLLTRCRLDRSLCETIVIRCLSALQLHRGCDSVVRSSHQHLRFCDAILSPASASYLSGTAAWTPCVRLVEQELASQQAWQ
jgi:hypothetical protein